MPAIEITNEGQLGSLVSGSEVTILDFWAEWAKPCAAMNNTFDQLADTYPNMKFVKIEAEKYSDMTEKYEVAAVPTFIFLLDGKVVDKIEGANGPDLINKISKYEKHSSSQKGDINARLEKLVNFAPVMLFMKGTPAAPQCGFSSKMIDLLKKNNVVFSTFNILTDEEVRNGLKAFSNWPTYPQLYVKGKLIGGLDIVKELSDEGELAGIIPSEATGVTPTPAPAPTETQTAATPVSKGADAVKERLETLLNSATVMLFMKGTPDAPKCGFSSKIVDILNKNNVKFSSFNILADEEVRQGLKTYSNWPTYPQLYSKGKLVGGLDIVKELSDEGQLQETLQ